MIDGNAGRLIYRGYDIHDLAANLTFEEVAYLLWNGDLPTKTQLAELNKRLIMERSIPADLKATIRNLPRTSNTLDVFEPPSQRSGRAFR
jgi:citrate synthase